MKRIILMAVVLMVLFVLFSQCAFAAIAKSGSWDQVTTSKNVGASSMSTSKFYWSGEKVRIEHFTLSGRMVEIKNGNTQYVYNPEKKIAYKITAQNPKSVQQMLQEMAKPVPGGVKIGSEKVSGFNCTKYKVTQDGMTAILYVSSDSRLPLRLKAEIRKGSASEVTVCQNIKLNYAVPNSMFTLPKGTKIEEQKAPAQAAPKADGK